LPGNYLNVVVQLSFITERKFASGPSYFTPTNTVSSTTITALKLILIIGLFDPEFILLPDLIDGFV
jgi:hypothetical protein